MIISMDAEKASGKIQQRFMIKFLQKVGKERTYFNIIKAIGIREEKELKGIQIAGRSINNLRYADDTTLMAKQRGTKEPLRESERGE